MVALGYCEAAGLVPPVVERECCTSQEDIYDTVFNAVRAYDGRCDDEEGENGVDFFVSKSRAFGWSVLFVFTNSVSQNTHPHDDRTTTT